MRRTTLSITFSSIAICAAASSAAAPDLSAQVATGHHLYSQGKYAEAAKVYEQVLKNPRAPDMWRIVERVDTICRRQLCKADDLLAAGKAARAFAEYRKSLTMPWAEAHHQAAARLGMGRCLAAQKKWRGARVQYEKALANKGALWPDRGRAQLGLARCYEAEGDAAAARTAYEKMLTMKNISNADAAVATRRLE